MKTSNLISSMLLSLTSFWFLSSTFASSPVSPDSENNKVDNFIADRLAVDGSTDIFIKMKENAQFDPLVRIPARAGRAQIVHDKLQNHSNKNQKEIRNYLDSLGVVYKVFWINNSIFVHNASSNLIDQIAQRKDVAYVRGNHVVPLELPSKPEISSNDINAIEWGVAAINADTVWAGGNTGEGIVVASIDTGVRFTHEALINQYRGSVTGSHDYNWFDPSGTSPASPIDTDGHGTHTMGTMVGGDGLGPMTNDIGVAPGATWIAAKGCDFFCTDFDLISSAQWILCPTTIDGTTTDCTKAPHIVSNSWGGSGGDPWYKSYVVAWVNAGILPVFSAGNSGPLCSTSGSPGDYPIVIGVGSTNINNVLSSFSSKGPGTFFKAKPNVVAPGENVRSSYNSSNNSYVNLSGTSMAAPHMAGTAALMLAANPAATLLDLYTAIISTTDTNLPAPPPPISCGGRNYNVYPNAIYGHGLIDANAGVGAM